MSPYGSTQRGSDLPIWRIPGPSSRLNVTPPGEDGAMERQLHLLESPEPDWHLDESTKEIGRKGVAEARQALQQARKLIVDQNRTDASRRRPAA